MSIDSGPHRDTAATAGQVSAGAQIKPFTAKNMFTANDMDFITTYYSPVLGETAAMTRQVEQVPPPEPCLHSRTATIT